METVGIRALKQNASAVVAEVAAGTPITVTDRGRPVAQIVPLTRSRLAQLLATGQARPAQGALSDLGPPQPATPGSPSSSEVLRAQRDAERY